MGGALRDITFVTDKGRVIKTPEDLTAQQLLAFEYGAKIRSEDVRVNFGGGACNAAAVFAKMGLSAAVISRVGHDGEGQAIIDNLKKRGVRTDLIQTDESAGSAFSFIVVDSSGGGGDRVVFSYRGALENMEVKAEYLKDAKWLYMTGLGKNWKEDLAVVARAVRENGIKLAWNPGVKEIAGGRKDLDVLLGETELLIVNKDEAIELVLGDSDSIMSAEEVNDRTKLIEAIKRWGAKNVVITDGKNGACLRTEEAIFSVSAFIQAQTDTTGAGDAFGSGLLAGYILTEKWDMALKYGILNSSGEVTEYGAESGIMTRQEIESKLGEVEIQAIG
jgi:sugar/nucleoside kinase (ribokinase family)